MHVAHSQDRTAVRRATARLAAVAVLLVAAAAAAAPAAVVDVDYPQVKDQDIGKLLLSELKIDIPGATFDYAGTLKRVRLLWDGTDGPLLLGARGLPVAEMKASLKDAKPINSPNGLALPLPRDPRYAVLPVADDEVVMGTERGLGEYQPKAWPAPTGSAFSFAGAPKDINLDEFQDRVDGFTITMSRDGLLVGRIDCKDRKAAKGLMSYIANRLPLLNVAAACGIEKAQFPKRMVDAAVIERVGQVITITLDLSKDAPLRAEADDFLIHTLRRRMKKAP